MCFPVLGFAQEFELSPGKKVQKVKFQLINNLIVIPLEVNGAKLSFILDSGVSKPILFNLSDQDSIQINNVSEVTIRGLGGGEPIKALSSRRNVFKIGAVKNNNQLLYVVLDKSLNFSPTLGIPIHGIIGYELFRDFVVDINYVTNVIKFHDPEFHTYKKNKRDETLPLTISRKKAYIDGTVYLEDSKDVPVKLLMDTGSSDAIWLFKDKEKGLGLPAKNYEDYLGKGLSGHIFGKRTKVNKIKIGKFVLQDAKAAFPDMVSYNSIKDLGDRNGSIGGEILKRFNMIFDYPNNKITIRKNGNFSAPFHYNLSGIELQHNGVRYVAESIADADGVVRTGERSFGNVQILFENTTRLSLVPEIVVSGIRAGSPADLAGLQEGDVILAVNGKRIFRYKLQEVMKMLNDKEGKRVRVLIERYDQDMVISFILKKLF
ncbi:aspartyl protease family protein [Spongiimicrobium sp. 3-5]|uniref:aspartyl protease family protein n=1 Tax=Spongiimicrobium sp. 3-5 TaxID=3332596 RepID=UPI003980E8C4